MHVTGYRNHTKAAFIAKVTHPHAHAHAMSAMHCDHTVCLSKVTHMHDLGYCPLLLGYHCYQCYRCRPSSSPIVPRRVAIYVARKVSLPRPRLPFQGYLPRRGYRQHHGAAGREQQCPAEAFGKSFQGRGLCQGSGSVAAALWRRLLRVQLLRGLAALLRREEGRSFCSTLKNKWVFDERNN